MKNNIIYTPSTNYNERSSGQAPHLIIVHYTDMTSATAALERLCDPTSHVSAHYLIEKTGRLHQMVDDLFRAWHAGKSYWQGKTDLNSLSIGIELDNPGHSHTYEPFPSPQIDRLIQLLSHLCLLHHIPPYAILGHSDIAPDRKQDPGELFPWQTLQEHGFGLIPSRAPLRPMPSTLEQAHSILESIGYGQGDLEKTLMAFQRHFIPHELTGTLTLKTAELLSRIPYLTFFP